jgi:plastocyanin
MATIRAPGRVAAVLIALGSQLVAACGEEEAPAGRTVTAAAEKPIEVVGTEYAFDPSTLVVEGEGKPIEITLDNQGSLAHNLTLFDGTAEVGATATFQGGESDTTAVDLEPGSYRMVCTVGDHEALGMVGELQVR